MRRAAERFRRSGAGAAVVEYALVVALVAVMALGALRSVGPNLTLALQRVGSSLSPAGTAVADEQAVSAADVTGSIGR